MTYTAPIADMQFALNDVLGFTHDDIDPETLTAILEEAGKLASDVLAPLNKAADEQGATLKNGAVKTADGFKQAYQEYAGGGWNAVPFDPAYDGQGLPWAVAFPVQEMWQAANMSFGLCPLLNQGAIEAIYHHGSQDQKDEYLKKLISGEWTGTMNLTEPQAGSDLGLLSAKAEPQDDGTYKVSGQKIYITYGDHDLTDNIIHLVIARTPGAPDDVKGISLFIVPKILRNGTRNNVECIGLEHKLGIHASPTCTMEFDGAEGYLVGELHQGLKYMFTMMNNARLSVGLQGVAIAERATQAAKYYAAERVQGRSFTSRERIEIDQHADVRRMLLTMQSMTEAGRLLTYEAAVALDNPYESETVDLLTPLVKSWCADMAVHVASIGIQVHGGMGFVEETGAAQYYRDARILPIYEGTNGIQAADLVFRKIVRDGGEALSAYMKTMQSRIKKEHAFVFKPYFDALQETTNYILKCAGKKNFDEVAAASTPYLKGCAAIAAGALMSHAYNKLEQQSDAEFKLNKQKTISFYLHNILPTAMADLNIALKGSQFI